MLSSLCSLSVISNKRKTNISLGYLMKKKCPGKKINFVRDNFIVLEKIIILKIIVCSNEFIDSLFTFGFPHFRHFMSWRSFEKTHYLYHSLEMLTLQFSLLRFSIKLNLTYVKLKVPRASPIFLKIQKVVKE